MPHSSCSLIEAEPTVAAQPDVSINSTCTKFAEVQTGAISGMNPGCAQERVSSSQRNGGFKRGFLLGEVSVAKNTVQKPKTTKAVDSSMPANPMADEKHKSKSGTTTVTADISKASKKKDSGWAKGFLANKNSNISGNSKSKNSTSSAVAVVKADNGSKAINVGTKTPIAAKSNVCRKKSDLGWAKGFLVDKNNHSMAKKNEKKDKPNRNTMAPVTNVESKPHPESSRKNESQFKKHTQSINSLLFIDHDNEKSITSSSSNILITSTNNETRRKATPSARSARSLISVISEDTDTDLFSNSGSPKQENQFITPVKVENVSGSEEGTARAPSSSSLLSSQFLVGTKAGEDWARTSSSLLIQEVSTTRKRRDEHSGIQEKLSILDESELGEQHSKEKPSEVSIISSRIRSNENDAENKVLDCVITDNSPSGVLQLQQELERTFSRQQLQGSEHDNDTDLVPINMKTWSAECRRCAWAFLLQRREQHLRQGQIQKKKDNDESKGTTATTYVTDMLQKWLFELFDAEYCSNDAEGQYSRAVGHSGAETDENYPLESILKGVQMEYERRLSFQAVFFVQEYYISIYEHFSNGLVAKKGQIDAVQRLLPLLARLVQLTGARRTRLAQKAWDTAILLTVFHITIFPSIIESSSSGPANTQGKIFEYLFILLGQQLVWQQSKRKPNAKKICQFQSLESKSRKIAMLIETRENLSSMLPPLLDLIPDLQKLLEPNTWRPHLE